VNLAHHGAYAPPVDDKAILVPLHYWDIRYGYLTDAVLGTAKADKLNIISNADSRLYK
jgi:hypothetical protein